MQSNPSEIQYAGFGDRLQASLIDSVFQLPVIVPLLWFLLKQDFEAAGGDLFLLVEQLLESLSSPLGRAILYGPPLLYSLLFWKYRSATPGKMLMDMKIVDATTGGVPSAPRLLLRCIGYVVNVLILLTGFLWIAFDKRKQGLHDKMANTVVIMTPRARPANQA
jgi:uncharacterized RDD family membrane protein YckC